MNLRYLSYLLYIVLMIAGVNAYAAETLEPVAKKGQVIVIYRGPCPSGKTKAAVAIPLATGLTPFPAT